MYTPIYTTITKNGQTKWFAIIFKTKWVDSTICTQTTYSLQKNMILPCFIPKTKCKFTMYRPLVQTCPNTTTVLTMISVSKGKH